MHPKIIGHLFVFLLNNICMSFHLCVHISFLFVLDHFYFLNWIFVFQIISNTLVLFFLKLFSERRFFFLLHLSQQIVPLSGMELRLWLLLSSLVHVILVSCLSMYILNYVYLYVFFPIFFVHEVLNSCVRLIRPHLACPLHSVCSHRTLTHMLPEPPTCACMLTWVLLIKEGSALMFSLWSHHCKIASHSKPFYWVSTLCQI